MKYKVPEGWEEVKLGEAILVNPRESLDKVNKYKKVSMGDVKEHTKKISGYELERYNGGAKFRNGDTLFARITPCLENGKISYVDILEENEIAFGSTEFLVLREKKNVTLNDYIYYLVKSPEIVDISIKSMVGSSGRQRVQNDVFKNITFNLPPLQEQKAIANTLSAIDDKIELNNKINQNLEAQAQAIFKSWFIDFEPFQDGEFVESELGMIPKGWEVIRLGDKFNFIKGRVPKYVHKNQPNAYPYLTKTVLDGNWDEIKYGTDSSGIRCEPLDILMMMDGASSSQVFYGYDGLVGSTLSLIDTEDSNIREILYMYFHIFNNELKNQNTGSAIPHANKDYINNIGIAIPSDTEYFKNLADFFMLIRIKILKNNKQNQKLSQLRDTLLPKLISGEIRIPLDK